MRDHDDNGNSEEHDHQIELKCSDGLKKDQHLDILIGLCKNNY